MLASEDAWSCIFRELDLEDVGRIARVCRLFYVLCQEEIVWRSVLRRHLGVAPPVYEEAGEEEAPSRALLRDCRTRVPCRERAVIHRHHDEVIHGCWSPDGSLFASASRDGLVILFPLAHLLCTDENSTANLPFLLQHQQHVGRVAFSPSGEFLMTGTISMLGEWGNLGQTFISIFRISTKERVYCLQNASFDAFPMWVGENQLIFNSQISLDDSGFRQQFSLADCDKLPESPHPALEIGETLPQFVLKGERNYHHVTIGSQDGTVLAGNLFFGGFSNLTHCWNSCDWLV
jgi:WD40 repeat protein